jgi:CDP-6-deoxy-D-xylo-4-hexulose-3-dehydrase
MKYNLASSSWDHKEIDAMNRVIDSGFYTMGKNVEKFESIFSSFFGSKYALMLNSGSSANLLSVAALFFLKNNPLQRGDEVIVPSVSWSTTYAPLQQYGLKVKFVDISLDTLNFDLDKLKEAITDKTRAIFAVNILGNPNEFLKINNIIKNKNIYLLEDNCESMGAKYENQFTGTFGIAGTFSSFFSHHISTMEGGMILTDNYELYNIMLSLRAHGWTRNLKDDNPLHIKSDNKFYESFNFILPGYNLRPLELSGAIGIEQIKKLPKLIEVRRRNAELFRGLFEKNEKIIIQKEIGDSSWFGFSLIINEHVTSIKRDKIIIELEKVGIETRPIVSGNFLKNKVLKFFDYEVSGSLSNSEFLDRNGFFVGNHHYDLTSELKHLQNTLNKFL